MLMRNECEKILLKTADSTKNRVTQYLSWNKNKHSTTTTPFRSLDEIFVDETVDIIMMAYAFIEGFNRLDVYKDFKEKGIRGYFSRSKTTGLYSVYAQEHFGFPTNTTTNGEDSDSESSSGDSGSGDSGLDSDSSASSSN